MNKKNKFLALFGFVILLIITNVFINGKKNFNISEVNKKLKLNIISLENENKILKVENKNLKEVINTLQNELDTPKKSKKVKDFNILNDVEPYDISTE